MMSKAEDVLTKNQGRFVGLILWGRQWLPEQLNRLVALSNQRGGCHLTPESVKEVEDAWERAIKFDFMTPEDEAEFEEMMESTTPLSIDFSSLPISAVSELPME